MYFSAVALTDIKNTFASIGELDAAVPPSSLLLKLAVSQQAIRYFVQSITHRQIIYYGQHTLHHVESDYDLVQRLERIFEKDEALHLGYSQKIIGIDTGYSVVPAGMFFPDGSANQMQLSQKIENKGLEIVYSIETNLYYKIKALFGNCTFAHLNSGLLSGETTKGLFVNLNSTYVDILHWGENGQLQLLNRYQYKTDTDFTYFLLLAANELGIDRNEEELILLGDIELPTDIYDRCYQYFKHIKQITAPNNVYFSKPFEAFPKYLHYNLYNLVA